VPTAFDDRLLRRAALLAGAACLTGVTLFAAAASRDSSGAAGSPVWPPGHWRAVIEVATVGAFVAYGIGVLLLARVRVSGRAVLAIAVAIQLIPLTGPLLLSTDAGTYVTYGRASQPYLGPNASVYGPLWTIISAPFSRIGDGIFALRALAAASALALVAFAWRLATRKALAAAFVGWNPLLALHSAGGGHNDALMMAFVLGALVLARSGSRTLGGAAWAASIAIKWSSAPLYLLWAIAERRRGRSAGLAGALACSALVAAAAFALYGSHWLHVFSNISYQSHRPTELGLAAWLHGLGLGHHRAFHLTVLAELISFGLFAVAAWRGRLRLGLAAVVLALLTTRLNAWYVIWGVALAAADDEDRFGRILAVAATGYVLLDAITTYVDIHP
jgi:hypothetical protein